MKKVVSLLLILSLCFGICACSADIPSNSPDEIHTSKATETTEIPKIEATQNSTMLDCTTEDVIIVKAVEMAKLTALRTNRDFLELYTSYDDLITLAQSFSEAEKNNPVEAFGFCFGETDMAYLINNITARLGDRFIACTNLLTHNTQINLPDPLSEALAVCLKFSAECYILVTFNPVQENVAYVQTYAIFPEVAMELLNATYFDVDSIGTDRIAYACAVATDVSCSYRSNVAVADAKYYEQLAKSALYRISIEQVREITEPIRPYVEHFSNHYTDVAKETYVYQFSDKAQQLVVDEYHLDGIDNLQLREIAIRELLAGTPERLASIYGVACANANAVIRAVAQPILLDGTPNQQNFPVLVVFVYNDGSACMVCIYGNEYNFLQYTFASMPELPENWNEGDLETVGLERMN